MRVKLAKICTSEDGKFTCLYQGTNNCSKCGVFKGQKFHSPEKFPVIFKAVKMSTLLKRLIHGER